MKRKGIPAYILLGVCLVFILISVFIDFEPGTTMGRNLVDYGSTVFKILPFIFILLGLFDVWVKSDTVHRHLGKPAGSKGFLWAILLGGTTVGPMIVSLPIAHTLYRKGARLSVVFTYLGASAVCRIPMTVFEASYLGILFTVIRYAVSIPLIIATSIAMGSFLERRGYAFAPDTDDAGRRLF